VRAYVINLLRSPERRTHMTAELAKAGIDYEFVTGVDERDLDPSDVQLVHPSYLARSDYRLGRAGNGLSHLRVYEKIISDGQDRALVLEDDVTLSNDLGAVLDALDEQLVAAEVALLNFDSEDTCELSREGLVSLPNSHFLALPIDISQPASGAAYVITLEACKRLAKSILPIRAHCDQWDFWYSQGALDRVRCVAPLAVFKSPSFTSTIEYYSPHGLKGRLLRTGKRFEVLRIDKLVSYRKQLIWRKWTRVAFVNKPFVRKPTRLE
jgi:glycosyl transferase, family 25